MTGMTVPDGVLGRRSAERIEEVANDLRAGSPWALFVGAGLSAAAGLAGWEGFLRDAATTFKVDCPPAIPEDLFPATRSGMSRQPLLTPEISSS